MRKQNRALRQLTTRVLRITKVTVVLASIAIVLQLAVAVANPSTAYAGTIPEAQFASTSCTSPAGTTHCTAVGYYRDSNYQPHPLIYTYDGSNWTLATVADPPGQINGLQLTSTSCLDSNGTTHCTAVGSYYDSNTGQDHPLIYNYDGTNWALATVADPPGQTNELELTSTSCLDSNGTTNCTAVGYYRDSNNQYHPLIYNYDGTSWTLGNVAGVPGTGSVLFSASCSSPTQCVAVGYSFNINQYHPLIYQPTPADPAPGYFLGSSSNAPFDSWNFNTIWQVTGNLPTFIAGQIVVPILPRPNPGYVPPVSSPSNPATPPTSPVPATASPLVPVGTVAAPASGRSTVPTAQAAQPTADNPLVTAIKKFLNAIPPQVLVSFPYVLFGSLLLVSGFMLIEMIRQARRLRAIQKLLLAQRNIAQARDTFWHLAANYLRAPITLLMGGVDLLQLSQPAAKSLGAAVATSTMIGADPTTNVVIANIANLVAGMQAKVASIMEKIESSATLQGISWPKLATGQKIIRSLRFWLPLGAVIGLVIVTNLIARDYRKLDVSNLALASQAVILLLVAMIFYWSMSLLGRARGKRNQAEAMLARQTAALDTARYKLITTTADVLDGDVQKLEATLDKLPSSSQAYQSAGAIMREGARRLRQIVDSFQLLIATQNNKLAELSPAGSQTKLGDVLADCVQELQVEIEAKQLRLQLPENLAVSLPGSSKLLTQVLSSVLSNAVAFSPKNATVEVTLNSSHRSLRITDHGPGITDDQLAHVFEPFTKADGQDALQLDHEGLGINLYIDREIMTYLGGSIDLTTAAGKGTTVTLNWSE